MWPLLLWVLLWMLCDMGRLCVSHRLRRAVGIIEATTLRVAQRLVCLVERLHQMQVLVPGDIWMVAPGQTAIGQPNRRVVSARRQPQNGIVIYFVSHGPLLFPASRSRSYLWHIYGSAAPRVATACH